MSRAFRRVGLTHDHGTDIEYCRQIHAVPVKCRPEATIYWIHYVVSPSHGESTEENNTNVNKGRKSARNVAALPAGGDAESCFCP